MASIASQPSDLIRVKSHFDFYGTGLHFLDQVQFSDGTVWNAATFNAKASAYVNTASTKTGTDKADSLLGAAGADELLGLQGDDVLDGGAGDDVLKGGMGNDTYVFKVGAGRDVIDVLAEGGLTAGEQETLRLQNIKSTEVSVVRDGLDLLVRLKNSPSDVVRVLNQFNSNDPTQAAIDQIVFSDNVTWNASTIQAKVNVSTTEQDFLTGYSGADTLSGGDGNDVLSGQDGNDVLSGETGNDYIMGDAGNDKLYGGSGNDTLFGGDGNDYLQGGAGNDKLNGDAGDNTLEGGLGDDELMGGGGNNTYVFNRGDGRDTLQIQTNSESPDYSNILKLSNIASTEVRLIRVDQDDLKVLFKNNSGDEFLVNGHFNGEGLSRNSLDQIVFSDGTWNALRIQTEVLKSSAEADTLVGYGADDVLFGGAGSDTIKGNAGNDTLYGEAGDDYLTGGVGGDTLNGGAGNDSLDGGSGADKLLGGTGNDVYVFGRGYGADTITDADSTSGNTDQARFLAGVAANQLWFRHVGSNLEVSIIGTSDKLTVQNWYSGAANQVEQFKTADNKTLLNSQVENLVSAMAAFAPPASGQTTLPANYQTSLNPVIAANWK